jgi:hypothetical protein
MDCSELVRHRWWCRLELLSTRVVVVVWGGGAVCLPGASPACSCAAAAVLSPLLCCAGGFGFRQISVQCCQVVQQHASSKPSSIMPGPAVSCLGQLLGVQLTYNSVSLLTTCTGGTSLYI